MLGVSPFYLKDELKRANDVHSHSTRPADSNFVYYEGAVMQPITYSAMKGFSCSTVLVILFNPVKVTTRRSELNV